MAHNADRWEQRHTPGPYGKVFWVNTCTGETHWSAEKPASPPKVIAEPSRNGRGQARKTEGGSTKSGRSPKSHGLKSRQKSSTARSLHFSTLPDNVEKKKAALPSSPVCLKCHLFVSDTTPYVIIKERRVHAACFICAACRQNLARRDYLEHQESTYCVACYETLWAPRCRGCHRICRARELLFYTSYFVWHAGCLRCCDCGIQLPVRSSGQRGNESIYQGPRCRPCHLQKVDPLGCKGNRILMALRDGSGSGNLLEFTPRLSQPHEQVLANFPGYSPTACAQDRNTGEFFIVTGHMLLKVSASLDSVHEIGKLRLSGPGSVTIAGLRSFNQLQLDNFQISRDDRHCFSSGFLALAPRGSLGTTNRDCFVWVDSESALVTLLFQSELGDIVDAAVRPCIAHQGLSRSRSKNRVKRNLGEKSSLAVDLFLWSHSIGLMRLKFDISNLLSEELSPCAYNVQGVKWIAPVDRENRPPPGVTSLQFLNAQRMVCVASKDPDPGLLMEICLVEQIRDGENALKHKTRLVSEAPPLVDIVMVVSNIHRREEIKAEKYLGDMFEEDRANSMAEENFTELSHQLFVSGSSAKTRPSDETEVPAEDDLDGNQQIEDLSPMAGQQLFADGFSPSSKFAEFTAHILDDGAGKGDAVGVLRGDDESDIVASILSKISEQDTPIRRVNEIAAQGVDSALPPPPPPTPPASPPPDPSPHLAESPSDDLRSSVTNSNYCEPEMDSPYCESISNRREALAATMRRRALLQLGRRS